MNDTITGHEGHETEDAEIQRRFPPYAHVPSVHSRQIGWWDSFKVTLKGQIVGLGLYVLIAFVLVVLLRVL
jgi:hypothetical protein